MPNHVENDLYIRGADADIAAVLEFIGMNQEKPAFDFKRIIPYPEPFASMDADHQAIEAAGKAAGLAAIGAWPSYDDPEFAAKREVYWRAAREAQEPLAEAYRAKWGTSSDGYNSGGYGWCVATWGTKWGAYDVARRDYDGKVIVSFQSAWSPPADAIFEALAERFPTVTFTLEYFEQGMGFCGGATWPSEGDYWAEDDEPKWRPGIKADAWHFKGYRGCRGG